jgi:hypothetical protein
MASLRSAEGGFFFTLYEIIIGHGPENLTYILSQEAVEHSG